jgi:poly(A) polymerase
MAATARPTPPSLAGAAWLAGPGAQQVFAALEANGATSRAVGGAVRNALMGKPVVDVDIATTARPEQVLALARAAGLRAVPTGVEHGTVTVIAADTPYEVTTLRRDVETDGRHATVAFTDDWSADAARRDFTINALYCAADGTVFDPLAGYLDLVARRVRFIGDAATRIREDYLRILRFFRVSAEHGSGPLDAAGLAACVAERAGLTRLSGERVQKELFRLLVAPAVRLGVDAMQDWGLLTEVLRRAPRPSLLARLAAIEAQLGTEPIAPLRLAVLSVEVPEDADHFARLLKLSNEDATLLLRAAPPQSFVTPDDGPAAARAELYRLGTGPFREAVLLGWTRAGAAPDDPGWTALWRLPETWTAPLFPVKGQDVLALGLPSGPEVGALLHELEAGWIAADFAADRQTLLAELRRLAAAR